MTAVDILQNLLALTVSMFIIRFLQAHWNNGTFGTALAYLFH